MIKNYSDLIIELEAFPIIKSEKLVWLSQLLTCIVMYRVSCILGRLWHNWQLSVPLPPPCLPRSDSPSAMWYLTNQWIIYNLPIDIINALSWAILTPFWVFFLYSPSACVIWLISELPNEVRLFISLPVICVYWLNSLWMLRITTWWTINMFKTNKFIITYKLYICRYMRRLDLISVNW